MMMILVSFKIFRCLYYGVLPESEAAQLYKAVMKRKGRGKSNTSSSSSPARNKPKNPSSTGSRKKILDEAVGDPGMQSGGVETVTSAVL